jgi:hypothetical protein
VAVDGVVTLREAIIENIFNGLAAECHSPYPSFVRWLDVVVDMKPLLRRYEQLVMFVVSRSMRPVPCRSSGGARPRQGTFPHTGAGEQPLLRRKPLKRRKLPSLSVGRLSGSARVAARALRLSLRGHSGTLAQPRVTPPGCPYARPRVRPALHRGCRRCV